MKQVLELKPHITIPCWYAKGYFKKFHLREVGKGLGVATTPLVAQRLGLVLVQCASKVQVLI